MSKTSQKSASVPDANRVPTDRERAAVKAFQTHKAAHPAPRIKVERSGEKRLILDHPDALIGHTLLMEAIGSMDTDFFLGLLMQVGTAASNGLKVDEGAMNFMLAVIKGIEPKDQLEAMLAAQMAATHM